MNFQMTICSFKIKQDRTQCAAETHQIAKFRHATGGYSTGTMIGHCLTFFKVTLDKRDKYPELKGSYLVMDNAPTHSSTDISKDRVIPEASFLILLMTSKISTRRNCKPPPGPGKRKEVPDRKTGLLL